MGAGESFERDKANSVDKRDRIVMPVVVDACRELAMRSATDSTRQAEVCEMRYNSATLVNMGQPGGQVTWSDLEEPRGPGHDD
jgi:hypothetical protein